MHSCNQKSFNILEDFKSLLNLSLSISSLKNDIVDKPTYVNFTFEVGEDQVFITIE